MRTLISTEELTSFRRCRRQWELGSPSHQNLEPIADGRPDLADAIREALAADHCPTCPFQDPCVAMSQGRAVDELLTAYRQRQPAAESGRIGEFATWGTGRGAAPPRWRSRQTPDARGPGP